MELIITMITYEDLDKASKKFYPNDVMLRYAFKRGAIYFMKEVCPELEEEMDIPRITLD